VPFPIEYKRGKRRRWDNDEAQLCAQALCLEEMLGVAVPSGAIFHVKSKRRQVVPFDAALRRKTEDAAVRLHQLLASGLAPPPVVHPKCRQCSLNALCLPDLVASQNRYQRAVRELFAIPAHS
jgi:CRISPR-associated exonuclease Cas4